jgi:hypothetical protein
MLFFLELSEEEREDVRFKQVKTQCVLTIFWRLTGISIIWCSVCQS